MTANNIPNKMYLKNMNYYYYILNKILNGDQGPSVMRTATFTMGATQVLIQALVIS